MTLRMPSTYAEVQTTFMPIHAYPAFRVARAAEVSAEWAAPSIAAWMSAQAATTELSTIKPKDSRLRGVTLPPNQRTSP